VSDAPSAEGVYVGITRGQFDLQAVAIRRRDLAQPASDDDLSVLEDEMIAFRATSERLANSGPERLAIEFQRSEVVVTSKNDESSAHDYADTAVISDMTRSDEELVGDAQAIARELRLVRADIARLESDVERRDSVIEASRSAGQPSAVLISGNATARDRIGVFRGRAEEIEHRSVAIGDEPAGRDIELVDDVTTRKSKPFIDAAWSAVDDGGPVAKSSGSIMRL
jgi:hypothetical protein